MFDSYLFRVLIVPSAVFLSVLFGAAYGSGREVVEFVSSNGPTGGLVAILVLVITLGAAGAEYRRHRIRVGECQAGGNGQHVQSPSCDGL